MDEGTDALSDRMAGLPSVAFDPADPGPVATSTGPSGAVVLMLSSDESRSWAAEAALALGGAWAREDRRLVLADLHLDAPLLDGRADAGSPEGMVDVLLYGASPARVSRPLRGDEFFQIPAGTFALDPAEVYRHPRWNRLIAGFRHDGATLVLFAPADAPAVEALIERADDIVLLGEGFSSATLTALWNGEREPLAHLRPPADALVDGSGRPPRPEERSGAEGTPAGEGYGWREDDPDADFDPILDDGLESETEHHADVEADLDTDFDADLDLPPPVATRSAGRGRGRVVLWLFILAALIGIAGFLLASLRPDVFSRAPGSISEVAASPAPIEIHGLNRAGDLLLYSVQVRAFTSFDAALEAARAEQSREPSMPYFVSPEEIQGVVYHRILAGFAADTLGATRLRDRLVESGVIDPEDAAGAWSLIQFTPLAFDLGEFATPEDAAARADSLLARQIPTYRVTIPYTDGSQRWKLYAGAYRDSIGAASMRARLDAVGIEARLIARTGASVPAVE